MQISTLPIHTDPLPDPVNDSEQVYADNVYSLILYFANQFVPGYNVSIPELNTQITNLNAQMVYNLFQGDYDPLVAYGRGWSASHNGDVYFSKVPNNIGNTPPVVEPFEDAYWKKAEVAVLGVAADFTYDPTLSGLSALNLQAAVDELAAEKADKTDTIYIGTTGIALNRASGALTLAGITLTTPNIGAATGTSFNSITGLASATPLAPAVTPAVGTSTLVARQDHVHPTNFTATATDIKMSGVQSLGSLTTFPRADHVHPSDTSRLPLAGGTMTGAITSLRETKVALPANAIDLATGNMFTKTITVATTFTVSNVPATGQAAHFVLELTNAGAYTITWFAGVKWAGGVAPTLTAVGVDILGFYSHDGGTTWRGIVMAKDSK